MLCKECGQPIIKKQRTSQQNRALHLYFKQLADELNDKGQDMRTLIKEEIDIPWSTTTVKDHLFRPLMKVITGKESTAKLTTDEIDRVFEILSKTIGERTGLHIPFPSIETLIAEPYAELDSKVQV